MRDFSQNTISIAMENRIGALWQTRANTMMQNHPLERFYA